MDPRENQMRAAMGFFILALAGLALSVSMASTGCRAAEGQESQPNAADRTPAETGAADQVGQPGTEPGPGTEDQPRQRGQQQGGLIMIVPRVPTPALVPLPAEDPPLLVDPSPDMTEQPDSPTASAPPVADQTPEGSVEPPEERIYFAPPGETSSIEEPAVVSPLFRAAEIAERERAQAEREARSRK